MLIEQIIEFELKGPGPFQILLFYNWLFLWQNKNLSGKFLSGLLFTAKIIQKAIYPTSPTWQEHLQNVTSKMLNFKRVSDLNWK